MKPKYLPSIAIACGLAFNFAMPNQANALSLTFTTGSIDAFTNTFTTTAVEGTPTQLTLNLTSTDLSALEIYLTSPSGKILGLATGLNGLSQTIAPTFSDAGTFTIETDIPYNGTYRPYDTSDLSPPIGFGSVTFFTTTPTVFSFADFGVESSGDYTLTITNFDNGTTTGSLNSATLDVTPVPFEFDGSSGIAIVGGAVAFRHWYKKRKNSKG